MLVFSLTFLQALKAYSTVGWLLSQLFHKLSTSHQYRSAFTEYSLHRRHSSQQGSLTTSTRMTSLKSLHQALGLSARWSSTGRLWVPTRLSVMAAFPRCLSSVPVARPLHHLRASSRPIKTVPQNNPQRLVSMRGLSATDYSAPADRDPDSLPPLPEFCSGCGVRLQQTDPDKVGFFQVPASSLSCSLLPPLPPFLILILLPSRPHPLCLTGCM